ncbi:class I SAM-dependent methyltransferase [Rhodoplanes roseus]|uniref:SAM-dependent methyltransferase n=1 Tax=Rhodoplanes roseus TaxID=29409 RepID=A0A327L0R5_9BRAD|nr:class I SAM-dependent methyltransferase [Rhodoplanes roseus]RAI44056.1 SAM-dependent methyltransferase [Rhodoplanes roseus]
MSDPQNVYDDPVFFENYARLRHCGTGLNDWLEQPALWSLLPPLAGLRVLDLGCGFGDFARKARRAGARIVVGLDVSTRMLAQARALTDDPAVAYRHGSIERLDLDGRFDLVVSSLTLHYVAEYAAAVARIARLLDPGGVFVFSVEHPICTARAEQKWVCDTDGRPLYWPIDEYRSEGPRSTRWFVNGVIKHHRTVETYVTGLLEAGLTLRALREPEPVEDTILADRDLHRRRPPILVLAATR